MIFLYYSVYKDASISYALPPYADRGFSSYQQPNRSSEIDVERPMDTFDDSFRIRSGTITFYSVIFNIIPRKVAIIIHDFRFQSFLTKNNPYQLCLHLRPYLMMNYVAGIERSTKVEGETSGDN